MYYALGNVYTPAAGWETPISFSGYWAVIGGPYSTVREARIVANTAQAKQDWPGKQIDDHLRCPSVIPGTWLRDMGISGFSLADKASANREARKWLEHITRSNY